jgi:DNA modification methylase
LEYLDFLATKQHKIGDCGKIINRNLIHSKLFEWQKDIVQWATKKGLCAIFLDTGLGKTFLQLEWARLMGENTLIVAPLSVARQTVREAHKIDLEVKYVRSQSEIIGDNKLWITNYEMIDSFDYSKFGAVVLDESSILKSIGGHIRQRITELCSGIKYKLCCTATPAPNDYIELGNHTEFLGICKMSEMLATFFINANKEHTIEIEGKMYRKKGSNKNGTEWRLKHHAEQTFFQWLSSWAITMTTPSDLGYDDNGFILPELKVNPVFISSDYKPTDQLFFTELHGIGDRVKVRKSTIQGKLEILKDIVNNQSKAYNNSYEQKRILQNVESEKQGTSQSIQVKNERPSKRKAKRNICDRRSTEKYSEETSTGLVQESSIEKESAEAKSLSNINNGVSGFVEETKQPVCDMRNDIGQTQHIPVSRPLSQIGESQRVIMPKLQPSIGENEGLTGIIKEGGSIPREQWIVWCGLDEESRLATMAIPGAIEIKGSDSIDYKTKMIEDFQDGKYQVMVVKTKIAGYGLNLQNSHNQVFFGLNDSWESFYQAIRRQWRYGQKEPVNVYLILHDVETEVYQNVMRKDAMARRLKASLIEQIKDFEKGELGLNAQISSEYNTQTVKGNNFTAMMGDSCERLKEITENSIDLSVYSPPFASLFTYSATERDLGNSRDSSEFFNHYQFIIKEILRVTKPGRLTCVHTSDIPAMAQRDGYIGIKDFPGDVIRAYEKEGWVFVGRAFVPKNPQAQAIRTHSSALLFVSLRRDSSDSRPALIDQILIFKKDGENAVPILPVKNGEIDNETWIKWANGVWDGIRETDTLQFANARAADDEKHVAPLQLATIERCIKLYSNPKETILTPFLGIGSEAYVALKFGRKAIGIELKPEYFKVAVENLKFAESMANVKDMFSMGGVECK